ncbi:hypothetical protein PUR71_37130 [Streptomyces sp. SP17BM10]|uniref:hypothetical protein n=1 Tax=Streptomyces sp. SP17BM10 TaxID=3002530 RepID=UPI002E770C0A|nr:hypothetical protein [Streptomyces sp. SP17BM10]MEE1788484.1 hypothetical protein [Streptomyces sp. SP17BM10]
MKQIKAVAVAVAAFAALAVGAAPAGAADLGGGSGVGTCSSKVWGGKYLCGGAYGDGTATYYFRDGRQEVFIIGTDHAVWTRWTTDKAGHKSGWVSMGGILAGPVGILATDMGFGNFEIGAMGTDGHTWSRVRDTNGNWSAWAAV